MISNTPGITPSWAARVANLVVAILFADRLGVYPRLPFTSISWDVSRDARLYSENYPVVAHPPCGTWGRYALRCKEPEGGCFETALRNVCRVGGVLEHPAGSKAFSHFGIERPERRSSWIRTWSVFGWGSCCYVEQGNYGHRARKPTWLFASGVQTPPLNHGSSFTIVPVERMSHFERQATPLTFAKLLISIARIARSSNG